MNMNKPIVNIYYSRIAMFTQIIKQSTITYTPASKMTTYISQIRLKIKN
jgi:hypothetical protein